MFTGDFNDDIWDEYQWEFHLNEIERKSTRLRKFIIPEHSDNIPRWLKLLQEASDEFDAVDAFIEEELLIDEAYFPGEDDEEIDDDDEGEEEWEDFLFDDFEDDLFFGDEDEYDDFDAGEEWKELSDDFAMSNMGSIDSLFIYNSSRTLAAAVLQWAETINPQHITSDFNEFIGDTLKIGAKIAGGYSFGFDHEFLGGNIAYTKKALFCANDALNILQGHLKGNSYITKKKYYYFHEQLFTLRNDIGIYIQELREQFYNGI
ncbi:hypothetical protein [Fodinibius sp. SL11]|uniref:hypothetical protein n=1 Tax=Fodinibius sp. SL11 TaxID=3425690 RepID=UPI003F8830B9